MVSVSGIRGSAVEVLLFDGTGSGYNVPYYARFARGVEVRRLRSHVKAVLVVGVVGNRRVLIGASLGAAYSDGRWLAVDWLREGGGGAGLGSGLYVVGDKLYGRSESSWALVRDRGWLAVVAVEPSLHLRIHSPLRLWAKELYERHQRVHRRRYLVESLIGSLKGR